MLLYQKEKNVTVEQEDTNIKISVHFRDHFHEMRTTVTFDSNFKVILAAKTQFISVPWDLCYEATSKMEGLVGLKVQKGIKEQVHQVLGGAMGCVHLVELAMDAITAVIHLRDFHLLPKAMPYKDKMEKMREINKGVCHTYSSADRKPELLKENLQSQLS